MTSNKSPFPGMDPYLEGHMWSEFHTRLAAEISNQLLPKLAPNYIALLNRYYVIESDLGLFSMAPKRQFYPDVEIIETRHQGDIMVDTQVATKSPLIAANLIPHDIPIVRVEIRDVEQQRLVTVIEILSPVNKQGEGYKKYLQKRADILQTDTHLLEIDLLRAGKRIPFGSNLPNAPYFIFLSRYTHRPQVEIWPTGLRDRLPIIPIPLLPSDSDLSLELQTAVNQCFNLVGYQRVLNYNIDPPSPRFSDEDLAWLKSQIQNHEATQNA
ncbi:DUF4058 family protein [Anaerolineales bacterium HSG6]|nr:DUF4058 family protein [Anaerolineales bacterium HSG6]